MITMAEQSGNDALLKSGTLSPNPWDLTLSGQNDWQYNQGTRTEDKAPQGCDPSAASSAGMARRLRCCSRPQTHRTTTTTELLRLWSLSLCPDNDITGGKAIWSGMRGTRSRAGQLFCMAAQLVANSKWILATVTAGLFLIAISSLLLVLLRIEPNTRLGGGEKRTDVPPIGRASSN